MVCIQSRHCQEKQSRETQTLKSLRSTKYKRNTDSEFLQKLRNSRKNKETQGETQKNKRNARVPGQWQGSTSASGATVLILGSRFVENHNPGGRELGVLTPKPVKTAFGRSSLRRSPLVLWTSCILPVGGAFKGL